MDWNTILSDWKTYAAIYVLVALFVTPKTVRCITKNWEANVWNNGRDKDLADLLLFHVAAFGMLAGGPITVVSYWVVWRFLIVNVLWKGGGLGLGGIQSIAESVLPDAARYDGRERDDGGKNQGLYRSGKPIKR